MLRLRRVAATVVPTLSLGGVRAALRSKGAVVALRLIRLGLVLRRRRGASRLWLARGLLLRLLGPGVHLEVGEHAVHGGEFHSTEPEPLGSKLDVLVVHVAAAAEDGAEAKKPRILVRQAQRVRSHLRVTSHLRLEALVHVPLRTLAELTMSGDALQMRHERFHETSVHLVQILVLHAFHSQRRAEREVGSVTYAGLLSLDDVVMRDGILAELDRQRNMRDTLARGANDHLADGLALEVLHRLDVREILEERVVDVARDERRTTHLLLARLGLGLLLVQRLGLVVGLAAPQLLLPDLRLAL